MDSKLHEEGCDCSTCWFQRTMGVGGTPKPAPAADEVKIRYNEMSEGDKKRVILQSLGKQPPTKADVEQMAGRRRTDPATGKPVSEEVPLRITILKPPGEVYQHARVHKLRPLSEITEDCCVLGKLEREQLQAKAREHAEKARDEARATQHEADLRMAQLLNDAAQATGIAFTPVGDEKPDDSDDTLKGKDFVVTRDPEGRYDVRHATDEERRMAEYSGDDCPSIRIVPRAALEVGTTLPPLTAEDVARIPPTGDVVVAHTSNPEYEKLANCRQLEALRDRTVRIDMPMPLLTADGQHKPPPDSFVKRFHDAQPRIIRVLPSRHDGKTHTLDEAFARMNEMLRKAADALPKPTLVVYDSISTPEGKTVTVSRKPTEEEVLAHEKFSTGQWASFVDHALMAPGGMATGDATVDYAAIRGKGEPILANPYHLGKEAWDRINAAAGVGKSLEGNVDLSLIALLKDYDRILGPAMTDEERREAEMAKFVGFHNTSPEIRKAIAEQHARVMDYVRQLEENDAKYGTATELTGDMNINKIGHYGTDSDPRAFGPFSPAQLRSLEAFRDAVKKAEWRHELDALQQHPAGKQPVFDFEGTNEHLARHIQTRMGMVQAQNAQYVDPFLVASGKTREECLKELDDCVPDAVVETTPREEK